MAELTEERVRFHRNLPLGTETRTDCTLTALANSCRITCLPQNPLQVAICMISGANSGLSLRLTCPWLKVSQLPLLRREVAGDVQDQLRDAGRIGVGLAVDIRHNSHVRGDRAIDGVQRRDDWSLLGVRP